MNDGMNLVPRESHQERSDQDADKAPHQHPSRYGRAEQGLGISQLALVRSALAAFLVANEAPVVPLVAPGVIAEAQRPARRPPR